MPLIVMPVIESDFWEKLFSRFSSYTKLKRAVAGAICYLQKLRMRIASRSSKLVSTAPAFESFDPLTTDELKEAEIFLCRLVQRSSFAEELSDVSGGTLVSRSSSLKWLGPTIDRNGLLRVGGRLSNASISENAKHPIVLLSKHPLSVLLARHYHQILLHAGPQLMLTTIRQKFWILGARNLARQVYHQCNTCFRRKPVLVQQSMADLPTSRVSPTRPFSTCGVDYCGPLFVKSPVRKHGPRKVNIAIFVCFSTRAVHIELVSDLTTSTFLAALRRFIARRGKIVEIHSDNGTAFKGASHALHRVYEMLKRNEDDRNKIFNWCANNEIRWKFIPPRAPHFGGLWEAAVKSAKTHLLKELRNITIAYEDLLTLLAQVEMCLNSRPLTPMGIDPSDLEALTPGHFLIGSSFQAVPEPCMKDTPDNRLNHWEQTQKQFQRIWSRWYPEYLQQLQTRASKGCRNSVPIELGRIVIVKDENLPPAQWPLGKITKTHPGKTE